MKVSGGGGRKGFADVDVFEGERLRSMILILAYNAVIVVWIVVCNRTTVFLEPRILKVQMQKV